MTYPSAGARATGCAPSFGVTAIAATDTGIGPLTPLLAFEPLGRSFSRLLFWFENVGPSTVTFRLSTSERGVLPDAEIYETDVAAGQSGHFDMAGTVFQFWELEAHTAPGDGYPPQTVTWGVVGVNRRWSHDAP